jgi:type II secretory pathway component PulL
MVAREKMMLKILNRWLLVLLTGLGAAGCATLPDTDALIARHSAQEASFETARFNGEIE